ncbi:alpha/beta-hydrolase, partial [Imleria badia]
DKPWGIWLNGGPGSSSLVGLFFENGPIHISNNYSLFENEYAWTTVADYVWIDQPVGTGFSTADSNGYVYDEDQMAADFMGFLENLVKVFPDLATRPLHLTGESYAGMYIPYITKAYFEMDNPPVNLSRIAIGDGSIASGKVFGLLPVVSVLETYPQIIGYD